MTELMLHIDGLVQERCKSSALAMELCYVFLVLTHWYAVIDIIYFYI